MFWGRLSPTFLLLSCPAHALFVLGVVGKGSPSSPGEKKLLDATLPLYAIVLYTSHLGGEGALPPPVSMLQGTFTVLMHTLSPYTITFRKLLFSPFPLPSQSHFLHKGPVAFKSVYRINIILFLYDKLLVVLPY